MNVKSGALGSSVVFAITRSVTLSRLQFPPLENEGVSEVQSFLLRSTSTVYSQVALDKSLHLSVFDKGQCGPAETRNGNLFYTAPRATQIAVVNVLYGSFQLSGFPIPLVRRVVAVNGKGSKVAGWCFREASG